MRERPANEKAISNQIAFLRDLQYYFNPNNNQYGSMTISELHSIHEVSKSSGKSCKDLGILIKLNSKSATDLMINKENSFEWNTEFYSDRITALKVLDFMLTKNKKQVVTPIAGMEDLVTAINRSVEAMNKNTVEINNALRVFKSPQIDSVPNGDLFKVDTQLLKLVSSIASNVYDANNLEIYKRDNDGSISELNKTIIFIAEDLLSKLLNKQQNGKN